MVCLFPGLSLPRLTSVLHTWQCLAEGGCELEEGIGNGVQIFNCTGSYVQRGGGTRSLTVKAPRHSHAEDMARTH